MAVKTRNQGATRADEFSRRTALGLLGGAGVAAALAGVIRPSRAHAQSTPTEPGIEPNSFTLSDAETRVSYTTTSEGGVPTLTYQGEFGDLNFAGDELRSETCALGQLVTANLGGFPDQGNLWLTLLLPAFNPVVLGDPPASFSTLAILKWEVSTIEGPPTEGALETYEVMRLDGTAQFLVF